MANDNAKVTNFLRDESQLKQDWLCLLMDHDHAPLDVAYRANLLKVEREFYPYADYEVTCETGWHARSIWEHEETYQTERQELVFVDYKGNEHKSAGTDYDMQTGRDIRRQSHYKTVYDTHKEAVIDEVRDTQGSVGPYRFAERVWTGPSDNESQLLGWASRFTNDQFHPVNANGLPGVEMPEVKTASEAKDEAERAAASDIASKARREVPGDRYENFGLSGFRVNNVTREDYYLSAYHVYYDYEGKQYDCLMTGGDNTSDVIIADRPIDDSIKGQNEALDQSIKQNGFFSRKTLFIIAAVILAYWGIGAFFGIFSSVGNLVSEIGRSNAYRQPNIIGYLPAVIDSILGTIVCLGGAAFCFFKWKGMQDKFKKVKAQKERFTTDNTNLKQQIFELIQNDSIPEEQKGPMIEQWVNNYKNSVMN